MREPRVPSRVIVSGQRLLLALLGLFGGALTAWGAPAAEPPAPAVPEGVTSPDETAATDESRREEPDGRRWAGPLRWTNGHPFHALFLDTPALDAVLPARPTWAVRLSHYSTMAFGTNIDNTPAGQALRDRINAGLPQEPLNTLSLAATAAATPGETYLFADTETTRLTIDHLHPFGPRWALEVELPLVAHHGGGLDPIIRGFHRAFGFGALGRNWAPDNRVQLFAARGLASRGYDGPFEPGLGDLVVRGLHALTLERPGRPAVALSAAVKLPTGPTSRFFGSGSTDAGLALSVAKALGDLRLTATVGETWHGRWAGLRNIPVRPATDLDLGVEWRFHPAWSARAGFHYQQHALRRAEPATFGRPTGLLGVGVSHQAGPLTLEGAFFENLTEHENAADLGVQFGVRWED